MFSQNFEHLNTFASKYGRENVLGIANEPNGGCSFLLYHMDGGSNPDTLNIGYYQYVKQANNEVVDFLVKVDSIGNVTKVKLLCRGAGINKAKICRDDSGNFYISQPFTSIFDSISLNISNGSLIFAKYDKNINLVWIKQTGTAPDIPSDLFFSQGHVLFTCQSNQKTTIGSKTFYFSSKNIVYGEINQSSGSVMWCNNLYNSNGTSDELFISGVQHLKGKFYLSGTVNEQIKIGPDTLYYGGFVVQTDSVGNYQKKYSLKDTYFESLTTDGVELYFSGSTGLKTSTSFQEFFAGSLTASLTLRWLYKPDYLDKYISTGSGHLFKAISNEGYIYFGGYFYSRLLINGVTLTPAGPGVDLLLLKMDYLGNVLWATSANADIGVILGMDAIAGKCVHAGGFFRNKISFGKLKAFASGQDHAWTVKISDNSIFRGDVLQGPYCAGDTIVIPYSKEGYFDTSNYFIAELSNFKGNFETGLKELGRLKSNNNNTVICILPKFQLETSGKYRIRIRSTNPPVQSFYRVDTLRLLIYSRDKANPGPPEVICLEDTIKLNTYGGTRWKWSPQQNMNDSNLRQPLVWPITNTLYQIIIEDSSGCGESDTAFKQIIVRKALKIKLAFKDTVVCDNSPILIPLSFEGGDSTNYQLQLFSLKDTISFSFNNQDSILYRPDLDSVKSETLKLILNDGCTSKGDTAHITISLRKNVILKSNFKDTTLCTGHRLSYKVEASGGISTNYQYQWKDLINNKILSVLDSFTFISTDRLKIQMVINDGCHNLGDTDLFIINVKPPLNAVTNLVDTALCFNENINLIAKGNGGDTTNHKISWILENKVISDSNNFLFRPIDYFNQNGESKTLSLIIRDNCSLPNDTISKTLVIKPSSKSNFSYDRACSKTETKFQFTGTTPLSPITTTFVWNFNNESKSNDKNALKLFSTTGKKTIYLSSISSNGCKDTISKVIDVLLQSRAEFSTNDICENDSVIFINKSVDATGYKWKFGDGQNSIIQNAIHKYQIINSTTFNVTLVAIVSDGCSDSITKGVTVNKNPDSDFTFIRKGNEVNLKANDTNLVNYKWIFGKTDSILKTTSNHIHVISSSDQNNICLYLKDFIGCYSKTCKNVNVGFSKIDKKLGFEIFPNPNKGNFIIDIAEIHGEFNIEIYNSIGQVIYNERVQKFPYQINAALSKGVYLIKVSDADNIMIQRVLVSE